MVYLFTQYLVTVYCTTTARLTTYLRMFGWLLSTALDAGGDTGVDAHAFIQTNSTP